MSNELSEKKSQDLGQRMRAEWDRRIDHDYRYWMSDGVKDDALMWETGERDLEILLRGHSPVELKQQTALEIGSGVGRLLKAASSKFSKVIGIDVSESACRRAKAFLSDCRNVEIICGSGELLNQVADNSIDLVYTFAALSSMPVEVIASYLCEMSRVLKSNGTAKLQVYLGSAQNTRREDTLAIRSFDRGRFIAATQEAGLAFVSSSELILPFEISDRKGGLIAEIVTLTKTGQPRLGTKEIERILIPEGENTAEVGWPGSRTEYLMALCRANQHMEAGDTDGARTALQFATTHFSDSEQDVKDMLAGLQGKQQTKYSVPPAGTVAVTDTGTVTGKGTGTGLVQLPKVRVVQAANGPTLGGGSESIFEQNLTVLRRRFPEVAEAIARTPLSAETDSQVGASGQPVITYKGVNLDQIDKPERAAQIWAERALAALTEEVSALVVLGFGGGFALEALKRLSSRQIHLVESCVESFKAALYLRDLREVLESLKSCSLTAEAFKANALQTIEASKSKLLILPQTQVVARATVDAVKLAFWSTRGINELQPSIAVIGPIYGGSLPIAAYTARALQALNQRVSCYDLSSFHKGYNHLGEYVRDPGRVNNLQSHYVELLSQVALEAVNERPVDIVISLAQAPLSPRVLTEFRKRGIITVMWFVEDCRRFHTWKEISKFYDYMFLIQRDEFPQLVEAAGAGRAVYLPVGCDPDAHRPLVVEADERRRFGSDISFVGAGYNNRQQMFAQLANRDFKIWGTEWPMCAPFDKLVQESGRRIDPADYVKIFNSSKVNLNLHSSMERDGVEPYGDFVNPRTFELASSGAFQLADERTLLPDLFEVGKEIITFADRKEMIDQIDYYVDRPAEREAISARARARALGEHSYQHRMMTMLGHIYADRFEELKAKQKASPWQRTLDASEPFPELQNRFKKAFSRGDEPKLDSLVADIQTGKGTLTDTEQKLLFLYHIKKQIAYVNDLRDGKTR